MEIPEARNVARSTKMDELRRRLVLPGGFDFETRWRLPASCGLVGLSLEMKSPPRDLLHGGPFKPQL